MKKKIFWIIYSLILIGIGILYGNFYYSSLISVFLSPFTFMGYIIRDLILENILTFSIGIIIFALIIIHPILYLMYRYKKRKVLPWEIIILPLLSIINLLVLYSFINQSTINQKYALLYNDSKFSMIQFAAASLYYLVVLLYLGLRIMYSKENKTANLITKILLYGLTLIITSNIIYQSINSILISFNNLTIELLQVVGIVVKYVYQIILNIAAIYFLNRLQKNFIRLNDGTLSSMLIQGTRNMNQRALIYIIISVSFVVLFKFIKIITNNSNSRFLALPIIELSVFIITWIISKYLLNRSKSMINRID